MSRRYGLTNIARALQRASTNPAAAPQYSPPIFGVLPPLVAPRPPCPPTAPWNDCKWQGSTPNHLRVHAPPVASLNAKPGHVSAALFAARRTMFIQTQSTPNPNSLMFVPGKAVMESGSANFVNAREAMASPLAKRLFGIDGVKGVFFGSDFVTVTKSEEEEWGTLKPEMFAAIMDFFASGQALITDEAAMANDDTAIHEDDSEVVAMIKELLDTRIRPAVQDDGGDIKFHSFDEDMGYVYLKMQGACASCPSSSVTLKSGIENMLMHYIPEVKAVCQAESEEDNQLQNVAQVEFNPIASKLSN